VFRAAGVPMAFGTDLLGESHRLQSDEFRIRADVLGTHEAIRSATLIAAQVLRREGQLGVVAAGALADLLVVDGDPLKDITRLLGQGDHLVGIMKAGQFVKRAI